MDILTQSRIPKLKKLFCRGSINTLEIGTGGGPFTIELLSRKNNLTVIEIDIGNAKKLK